MTPWIVFLHLACLFAVAPTEISGTARGKSLCSHDSGPDQVKKLKTEIYVLTKEHPHGIPYNISGPTVYLKNNTNTTIITHGYKGDKCEMQNITKEYLNKSPDANLILIDWAKPAKLKEEEAAACAVYVGKFLVGSLISNLSAVHDIQPEQTHLVGYNMGAHLMGAAGRVHEGKIARITGLDPYRRHFQSYCKFSFPRLTRQDAKFVDIFHTNAGRIGSDEAMGTVDFYANGGEFQPKCKTTRLRKCSALASIEYFAESIRTRDSFYGRSCPSYEDFLSGKCNKNPTAVTGEYGDTLIRGTFFYQTNAESPYGRKEKGALPQKEF